MKTALALIAIVLLFAVACARDPHPTICIGREDGYFVNNPETCQAYWICQGDIGFSGDCGPEFNFNEAHQLCDLPENYPCTNPPGPDPTPEPFDCPAAGIHFFGVQGSCTHYHFCFAGNHTVRECGNGLLFDNVLRICDIPDNVSCNQVLCPPVDDLSELITIPSKHSCEVYYICYKGEPLLFRCAEGIHWNQAEQECDLPDRANCLIEESITCPDDGGMHFIPHPRDKRQYYICAGSNKLLRTCPTPLIFDPTLLECNIREQVQN